MNLPCCCGCCEECGDECGFSKVGDECGCGEVRNACNRGKVRCRSFEWFAGFRYLNVGEELNIAAQKTVSGESS